MFDGLLVVWQATQQWTGDFALMLLVVFLCWPFEQIVPRILVNKKSKQRTVTIAVIALLSVVVLQAVAWWAQLPLIDLFVKFKFFSLSKLPIPDWLLIVVSFLLLDFLYYLAHVIAHYVRPIWQLHKIHHSDEHVTAFSGFLHHPLESIYITVFIVGLSVMLGIPVLVYVYFGLALVVHSIFVHADIALPAGVDRKLRLLIVTPDIHRTHHSQNMAEGNSNFGAMFTIWDRMFGTYVDQTREPVGHLTMGLPEAVRPNKFSVKELLLFPFRGERQN